MSETATAPESVHDINIPGKPENYQRMLSIPIPDRTSSYTPIPHAECDGSIREAVQKMGLYIGEEEFKLNGKGTVALGMYTLLPAPPDPELPCDMCFRIAWRNSYDKSRSLVVATGFHVHICSNTSIFGDISNVTKKHTGNADRSFGPMMQLEVAKMEDKLGEARRYREQWSNQVMPVEKWSQTLGELVFSWNALDPNMISPLRTDMEEGPFAMNSARVTNKWGLYMNITHALKQAHPNKYFEMQQNAFNVLRLIGQN